MTHSLQFGKRAFILAMIVATVFWAMGLAALSPLQANAASAGQLIKMAGNASVYYLGSDNKRYVFPNAATYNTWYSDFSGVVTVSQSELQGYIIGGNVTVKPGATLVKITTDPKVYAVTTGGELLAIADEATAVSLYGAAWNTMIIDVPDSFFTNYTNNGTTHTAAGDIVASASINADKGLGTVTTPAPTPSNLSVALSASSPASASTPAGAADVIFATYTLTGTGTVTGSTNTRGGLAENTDLAGVKNYQGTTLLARGKTLNSSGVAAITYDTPLVVNGSVDITLAVDIATGARSGNVPTFTVVFNLDGGGTLAAPTTVGHNIVGTTIAAVAMTFPTSINNAAGTAVDSGDGSFHTLAGMQFTVTNNPVVFTSLKAYKKGNGGNDAVDDLRLVIDGTNEVLAETTEGWGSNGTRTFSFNRAVAKGDTLKVRVQGKIVGEPSDTVAAGVRLTSGAVEGATATDSRTNTKVLVTSSASEPQSGGTLITISIRAGSLTVREAAGANTIAAVNHAAATLKAPLGAFTFSALGEIIEVTQIQITFSQGAIVGTTATVDESDASSMYTNCGLYNPAGEVLGGPVDPVAAGTATFTDVINFPIGDTTLIVKCDIASGTDAGATTAIQMVNPNSSTTLTATGLTSGTSITAGPAGTTVADDTQTVANATLTATTLATPAANTVVAGAAEVHVATLDFSAVTSGEDVLVTAVTVANTFGATAAAADVLGVELKQNGTRVAPRQTSGTTAGQVTTFTFTFDSPLRVTPSTAKQLKVYADFSASATIGATETHIFDLASVTSTGASTGNSVTVTPAGAGQTMTLAASGTLAAAAAPGSPTAQVILLPTTDMTVLSIKFTAASEKITLGNMEFEQIAGNLADIASNGVSLWVNGTEVGRGSLNSSSLVTFNVQGQYAVEDGAPVTVELRVSTNSVSAGATQGATSQWRFSQMTTGQTNPSRGQASGTAVTTAADIDGVTHRVQSGILHITPSAAFSTTMQGSTSEEGARVAMTAIGDDASLSGDATQGTAAATDHVLEFVATFSGTPTGNTSFTVVDATTNVTYCSITGLTAATSMTYTCDFGSNTLDIAENATKTLIVRHGSLAGLTTSGATATVSLTMPTSTTTDNANDTVVNSWSDIATTDVNGWGVCSSAAAAGSTCTNPVQQTRIKP